MDRFCRDPASETGRLPSSLVEDGLMDAKRVEDLHREACELTAIMVASRISASGKRGAPEERADHAREEEPQYPTDAEEMKNGINQEALEEDESHLEIQTPSRSKERGSNN